MASNNHGGRAQGAGSTAPIVPRQRVPLPSSRSAITPPSIEPHGFRALTVIVPTRNEAANVGPLVERLGRTLQDEDAEILFVDDSDDETPEQIELAAAGSPLPVRLHHRAAGDRAGGLGGAVLSGLSLSERPLAVVMDGDLQHPPELVPDLVRVAEDEQADVVVASRHVTGGSSSGLSNGLRVGVSSLSTLLVRILFPRRLAGVTDPMTGFFLVRRSAVDLDRLQPDGFKILVEILARTPGLKKREVPLVFGDRLSGESKASLGEGARFLRQVLRLQVSRLRASRLRPSLGNGVIARGLGFATVGVTGIFVNSFFIWLLADPKVGALNYLLAAAIATQCSSTWNFAWVDSLVYAGPKRLTWGRRWLGFLGMSNVVLIVRIPLLALLVSGLGLHYLVATAMTLMLGFMARFASQERLTLRRHTA
jgi:dolichol-phosphate mannosyltransferase